MMARSVFFGVGLFLVLLGGSVCAQHTLPETQERVIHYDASAGLGDPVAELQRHLDDGTATLKFEKGRGYLGSLLDALRVRVSSQSLVFSKTSSQRDYTSPKTPRAIYFADDVYVGWGQDGPLIDLAAVDPDRGPIFYTLEQNPLQPPHFTRRKDCIECHLNNKTLGVPGFLVRSVYTDSNGVPLASVSDFVSGHSSPLRVRWGGWYVSGTHFRPGSASAAESAGELHLGNTFATDPEHPERLDPLLGANVTDLRSRFDTAPYLSPHSDLVALLVLEHALRMQNLITVANYETRCALDEERARPETAAACVAGSRGWPEQRIALAGEMLLEYLLLRSEAPLLGPVEVSSRFAAEFGNDGPCDSQGRSLRQLDLKTHLFRYPCSFLIYSASFDALPEEMRTFLWRRLAQVLSGQDRSETYASLTAQDRQSVLEILRETKPEFAAFLQSY